MELRNNIFQQRHAYLHTQHYRCFPLLGVHVGDRDSHHRRPFVCCTAAAGPAVHQMAAHHIDTTGISERSPAWKLRDVRWKHVFALQTWGLIILIIIGGGLTYWGHYLYHPKERTAYLYDAQITLPLMEETVSYAAGAGLPWAAFMLTLLGVEFGIMYRKQTLAAALQAFIHTLLWGITLFVIVLCITEVTKPYAGRLRPDFMDRCNPVAAQRAGALDPFEQADCQVKGGEVIKEGRLSFPSGHSSNSMSICLFGTLYMSYSMFWRGDRSFMDSIHGHASIWMRLLMEIVYPLLFLWNLIVFLCSWFIGVSRYHDNRHHVADIIGGFVLAALVTMPCFISWAGQLHWYAARLAAYSQKEAGLAQQLPGMAAAEAQHDGKPRPAYADIEQGKGRDGDAAVPKVALERPAGSLTHGSAAAPPSNGSASPAGIMH